MAHGLAACEVAMVTATSHTGAWGSYTAPESPQSTRASSAIVRWPLLAHGSERLLPRAGHARSDDLRARCPAGADDRNRWTKRARLGPPLGLILVVRSGHVIGGEAGSRSLRESRRRRP